MVDIGAAILNILMRFQEVFHLNFIALFYNQSIYFLKKKREKLLTTLGKHVQKQLDKISIYMLLILIMHI